MGAAYAACARDAGAALDDEDAAGLERGFARAMRAAPPLAFGKLADPALEAAERAWWRALARAALEEAALLARVDFDRFFDLAWAWFASPAAWRIPADVRPALRALRSAGVPLAIFSNWDRRLRPLLVALHLDGFFARVVVSSTLPVAKPDAAAYAAAMATLSAGDPAWRGAPIMVGDRFDHDVAPALAAGWGAFWLDRGDSGETAAEAPRITSLLELPGRVAALGVP